MPSLLSGFSPAGLGFKLTRVATATLSLSATRSLKGTPRDMIHPQLEHHLVRRLYPAASTLKFGMKSTVQLLPSKRPKESKLNLTGATSTWSSVITVSPETKTKGTLTTADLRTPMLSPVAEMHSLAASRLLTTCTRLRVSWLMMCAEAPESTNHQSMVSCCWLADATVS